MTTVFGRRMRFGPILGAGQGIAPIQFAFVGLSPTSRATINADKERERQLKGGTPAPPQAEVANEGAYAVAQDTQRPQGTVRQDASPKAAGAKPGAFTPESIKPYGRLDKQSIYTRTLGSESPTAKTKYAQRELTPEDEQAISEYVASRRVPGQARYINPMAVALEIDAPVHRIAHRLETVHRIPPKNQNFNEWLEEWKAKAASEGLDEDGVPIKAVKPPEPPPTEDELARQAKKAAAAEQLARYARGVTKDGRHIGAALTPAEAARAAAHLSLAEPEAVVATTLRGWDYQTS